MREVASWFKYRPVWAITVTIPNHRLMTAVVELIEPGVVGRKPYKFCLTKDFFRYSALLMATVYHEWAPAGSKPSLIQADGPMGWEWKKGDGQHYWAFSIRPKRVWSSAEVEVVRQWTAMDARNGQIERFQVDVRTGGICELMFNVIRVEEA